MDLALLAILIAIVALLATTGTFLLEIWAFKRLIGLLEPIEEKVMKILPDDVKPGEILAEGILALMEKMAAKDEEGERTRKAFGSVVLYGTNLAMASVKDLFNGGANQPVEVDENGEPIQVSPLDLAGNIDLKMIPKKIS